MNFIVLRQRCGGYRFLASLCLSAVSALASGPGPGGVNLGFNFNWNNAGEPLGYTASFIQSINGSGATLNNCGGPVTATTQACDFVITYSIGGAPQNPVVPGGTYSTWTGTCDQNPNLSAPLTLFNCFNQNSFGQIFKASATGALSGLTMQVTCLNPSGQPPTGLQAFLYQVNAGGNSIPASPLAQTPVDLSACPTLASWTGHTFSLADFANIPMNFSGVSLTAGNFYAIYFGGLAPGTPLPGSAPSGATSVPTLSDWGVMVLALLLVAMGSWKLRNRLVA